MVVHKTFASLNRLLPKVVTSPLRAWFTAILTPIFFSWKSGHFKSSLMSKAVDKNGSPLPWYTYSSIDFLLQKDFSICKVLEFGAGQSTLWWAKRAQSIISLEADAEWYEYISKLAPQNVLLFNIPNDLTGIEEILRDMKFDVIIVDGHDRFLASYYGEKLLNDGGVLILDNSEGYWGPEGTYPIMDLFRMRGFSRIDFYWYAPGVIQPHCTSLFFKDSCFLLKGIENPRFANTTKT